MTRPRRTSTHEKPTSPSADSATTTSTSSSPPEAQIPSDDAPPPTESPPAGAVLVTETDVQPLTPDQQQALGLQEPPLDPLTVLANLATACERYSLGIGAWDDVLYCVQQADEVLGQHGIFRRELVTEARHTTVQ